MNRLDVVGSMAVAVVVALVLSWAGETGAKPKKPKKDSKVEEPVAVWPSPLDPGAYDPFFQEFSFGKDLPTLLSTLRERMFKQLQPLLKATTDPKERDMLTKRMDQAYKEVEASYTEFKGQDSGYSISVIGDDIRDNAGESLIKYSYARSTAYYLMSDGLLWKLFICADPVEDFASLVIRLSGVYGDPREIVWEDASQTVPIKATWRDGTFEVVVEPKSGIFTCQRLSWTYLPEAVRVAERRAKVGDGQGDSMADQWLKDVSNEDKNNKDDKKPGDQKKK